MALVNVTNMVVLDNPTHFQNPFQFEITFECLQELEDDLEWKVLYVGSAHDAHQDQVLDEILVGPVPVGLNKFVLQADAPAVDKIPTEEVLGVTVVLVTCSYKEREFVRVGYYVNNELMTEEGTTAPPPELPAPPAAGEEATDIAETPAPRPFHMSMMDKVQRQILADKPRVTKFPIPWDSQEATKGSASSPAGTAETTEMEVE